MNDKPIIEIAAINGLVIDIGVEEVKKRPSWNKYRYFMDVEYTTNDGCKYLSKVKGKTRKGLQKSFLHEETKISEGKCKAFFHDEKFCGLSVTY